MNIILASTEFEGIIKTGGLGDAILCAKSFVGNEPFAVFKSATAGSVPAGFKTQ